MKDQQQPTITATRVDNPDRSAATEYRINDPVTHAIGYAYADKDEPGFIRITGASAQHHSNDRKEKDEHNRQIFTRIREALRTTVYGPVIILP